MPDSYSVEQKKPVAVLYGASPEPALVIAERLASGFQKRGFAVELGRLRRATPLDLQRFAAIVLIASISTDHQENDLLEFVRAKKHLLENMPVALISMSVAGTRQKGNPKGAPISEDTREKDAQFDAGARTGIDDLFAETGWRPKRHWPIAGAITYMRYNVAVRLILKLLSKGKAMPSGRLDDWRALDAFLDEFVREIDAASGARS